jgi:hypothetical protein
MKHPGGGYFGSGKFTGEFNLISAVEALAEASLEQ